MTIPYILHFSIINFPLLPSINSSIHLSIFLHIPIHSHTFHPLAHHSPFHPTLYHSPIHPYLHLSIYLLTPSIHHPFTHPSIFPSTTHHPIYISPPPPNPSSLPVTHLLIYLSAGYLLNTSDTKKHFCWGRQGK